MSEREEYEAIRMAREIAETKLGTLREAVRLSEERAAAKAKKEASDE